MKQSIMKAMYRNTTIRITILSVIMGYSTFSLGQNSVSDSLSHYMEVGAKQNPEVQSGFAIYRAAMEKIPQAAAFDDPELEVGFLFKPMETVGGKQVADIKLMQMFPWFGTQKAARTEALEMSKMAYEKFRESRDNLWFKVKQQWYQLVYLKEQYRTTQATVELLRQLEQLATVRYSAGPSSRSSSAGSTSGSARIASPSNGAQQGVGNAMAMGGAMSMGASGASGASNATPSKMSESMPSQMAMNGASESRLSDILRIQIERLEVENQLKEILSKQEIAKAAFNALLNRDQTMPIHLPDSLVPHLPLRLKAISIDSILIKNPMIRMIDNERQAYEAKTRMDRKMSYPMIGIGVQYSLRKASDTPIGMPNMNGKDMIMPMIKVSLPIFRKKYRAQERENKSYVLSSEFKKSQTQNLLETEYIRIQKQLEDAERAIALYRDQYQLSQVSWRLILREFSAGKQPLSDVIQVERQLLNYKLKKSEATAQYNTLVAELEKLTSTF